MIESIAESTLEDGHCPHGFNAHDKWVCFFDQIEQLLKEEM